VRGQPRTSWIPTCAVRKILADEACRRATRARWRPAGAGLRWA
jgi:hypothetical protein